MGCERETIDAVTICEEIAEWAVGLSSDDLPASVRERAELQAVCVAAGRAAGEEAAGRFAAVASDGPVGEIYRSAAASIAHDWDDYLFMGYTGHSAVPAAAAFAADPGSVRCSPRSPPTRSRDDWERHFSSVP